MTNVLISGGGGFLGAATRAVAESRGDKVWTYDASAGDDVRDADRVLQAFVDNDIDVTVHLAGVLGTHELFDTPGLAVDVNINGTLNVLEACRQTGAAYVGIGMPDVFKSIYTATKIAAIRLADAYRHTHGIRVAHVRAYNAFGEGQAVGPGHPQKIVPHFAVELANGRPIPIWGDGSQGVDLIYAHDLGLALAHAAQCLTDCDADEFDGYTWDGGTGTSFTVVEVARMTAAALNLPCRVEFLPMRRGEVPTQIRATNPFAPFEIDDFERTVRWYAERYTGENDPWRSGVSS